MVNQQDSANDDDGSLLSSFVAGETIFLEGEAGRVMFIIESGEIEILRGRGGREIRLALLGPGDFFGELGVLELLPRSTTARSVGPSRVLSIDAPTFDRLLQEHPELAVRLLRRLSAQLRDILLEDLKTKRAVAGVLAGVERRAEVISPIVLPVLKKGTAEAPTGERPGSLHRLIHPESGKSFPISGGLRTLIGRPDSQTGEVPQIDLEPLDTHRSLSRRHAVIEQRGESFYIREGIPCPQRRLGFRSTSWC